MNAARLIQLASLFALTDVRGADDQKIVVPYLEPTAAASLHDSSEQPVTNREKIITLTQLETDHLSPTTDPAGDISSSGSASAPVNLPAITVAESRQRTDQLRDLSQGPLKPKERPTIENGGILGRAEIGKVQVELGVERWTDLFKKDAKFTDKSPILKVDLLRFKR